MKTFRPTVEQLEDRCTPAALPGDPSTLPADYAQRIAAFNAMLAADLPRVQAQAATMATMLQQVAAANVGKVLAGSPASLPPDYAARVAANDAMVRSIGTPPNPAGSVPTTSQPHVGQAFAGDLAWMASFVHRPEASA